MKNCLSKEISRFVILWLLLALYIFAGAFLYIYIETCQEERALKNTDKTLSCKCNELKNAIHATSIRRNESDIFKDIQKEFLSICSDVGSCTKSEPKRCRFDGSSINKWSWFCWNTISTIGYGSPVPRTKVGKICIMPYSAIGITLVLAFLGMGGSILKSLISKWISLLEKYIFNIDQVSYKETKVLFVTIFLTAISTFINAALYSHLTGVDFLTSFYFYYVTFTTIGYGDYDMKILLEKPTWGLLSAPLFWLGLIGTSTLVQAVVDVIQK